MIAAVILNGALMPQFGYYMPWYVVSGVLLVIGGSLLHTIGDSTGVGHIYGFEILTAVGAGLTLQTGYSVAEAKFKHSDIPAILGLMNISQIGSTTLALTLAGAIFQNLSIKNLTKALDGLGYSAADIASAVAGAQSPIFQTASAEVKALAVHAIVQALQRVWILVIVAGAVVLVSSVFMKREKLFQHPVSENGEVDVGEAGMAA
jgi:hypothetical protein